MSSSDYVERAGRLVVDANIAIGVILSGHLGRTRQLLEQLAARKVILLAPEELLQEVEKHLVTVVARSLMRQNITGDAFIWGQQGAITTWHGVQAALWIVPSSEYQFFAAPARRRVPADPQGWPYIALGTVDEFI